MENFLGTMGENIKGNGFKTKWMDKVCLHGAMDQSTKVNMNKM